jgi:uncharacterized repeat protein (TIGR03803 family)
MHGKIFLLAAVFTVLAMAQFLVPGGWAEARYKVIYNFQGGRDGMYPTASLVADAAGNLYGVTAGGGLGGNGGCGTVFELEQAPLGWRHKVLYRFPGDGNQGCYPYSSLALDGHGNLYSTTVAGGGRKCRNACGVVFELSLSAGGRWRETVLHTFNGGADGAGLGSVVLDRAGNVYGSASTDGVGGAGTVFELVRPKHDRWTVKVLHSFSGPDGASPVGVVFDGARNLYGVTAVGGAYHDGVAFELSPASGGAWKESTLYDFEGSSDGAGPDSAPTLEGGNLYGATIVGGAGGWGTVFQLSPGEEGSWAHRVLYGFTGSKDGRYPYGPFAFEGARDLYGSARGDVGCLHSFAWRCGDIFRMVRGANGGWKFDLLHRFLGGASGAYPSPPVLRKGKLYGVAEDGGNCTKGYDEFCGVAFEITP